MEKGRRGEGGRLKIIATRKVYEEQLVRGSHRR